RSDTCTTQTYTLSLHDALPIFIGTNDRGRRARHLVQHRPEGAELPQRIHEIPELDRLDDVRVDAEIVAGDDVGLLSRGGEHHDRDRKSTRLNSSHVKISYAVFC